MDFCPFTKTGMSFDFEWNPDLTSPMMRLQGHQGEVFSCEFHPDGQILLSSGADKQIYIWSVFDINGILLTLQGHTGSIMEAHFFNDGDNIVSCSTDQTVAVWDTYTGTMLQQLKGHKSFIYSVNRTVNGAPMICSGSEDSTVHIWDPRSLDPIQIINTGFPITSTCFNLSGDSVIYGGADNTIVVWDLRTNKKSLDLKGHSKAITGISLSPDGSCLLSNSMDNTLRVWNIGKSVHGDGCLKIFDGLQNDLADNLLRCAWTKESREIAAGSCDGNFYVFDILSERFLTKLPVAAASLNDIDFHPNQDIFATVCSDKNVYMSEICF